jgi:hypothetical protein
VLVFEVSARKIRIDLLTAVPVGLGATEYYEIKTIHFKYNFTLMGAFILQLDTLVLNL